MSIETPERDFLFPVGDDFHIERTRRRLKISLDPRPHFLDATMLYAPRSGGVKRYLSAKKAWFGHARPGIRHTLLVPGAKSGPDGEGVVTVRSPKLPFGDGYRWPSNVKKWSNWIESLQPSIIEAGDPYTPGQAALEAGQKLGVPVIGFCHSDPAALAAIHFGEWAKKPVEKRWAKLFNEFDQVIAPSHFIVRRLAEAGVDKVVCRPLGVDVDTFRPERRDRGWLNRRLGLAPDARVLVFAGRPAREKNIDVLIEAVQQLGDPYVLVLVGAGAGLPAEERVISMPYERDPKALAKIIASCDAFVHANDHEAFGLIVLEAMACGVPICGVAAGGVGENVDRAVGRLATTATAPAFAAAIEDLFSDDRDVLAAAARDRATQRFAWDRVFTDLSAIYASLARAPAFEDVQAAEPIN
jgi:alpha-1,6-mannosyltransferase